MRTTRRRTAGRLLVALLVSLAILLAPLGVVSAPPFAYACSIGSTGDGYARFGRLAAEQAQITLVATVTHEESIPRPPNTQEAWVSTVAPLAVLGAEMPEGHLVIPYIGFFGGDCSGGPRLRVGERVLISIVWGKPSYGDGEEAWQFRSLFSKVALEGGQATLDWHLDTEPLGPAGGVIREYGRLSGATDAQIEAAIEAASAPIDEVTPPPEGDTTQTATGADDGGSSWHWYAVTTVAGFALVITGLVFKRRRERT